MSALIVSRQPASLTVLSGGRRATPPDYKATLDLQEICGRTLLTELIHGAAGSYFSIGYVYITGKPG
jgi:hypothetical protein